MNKRHSIAITYDLLANPLHFNKWIQEKYDCIVACNHNAPSYLASYIKGGTKVLWIRGDMRELDYRKLQPNTKEYKQVKQEYDMQANVLKCFDSIVVISDVVKQTLAELFGMTDHVVKISNSIDSDKIELLSQEKVDLPDRMLLTTLGRLDYNKNQILLLKAAREMKKKRNDFMIYLLGDGDDRSKLEKYIQDNGLDKNVKILGFVENPYPYIKNSVATVLTSRSEGLGLALVESVLLNTPIISTDVGVAKELIEKYDCGALFQPNEKELASVLLEYLSQYDGYKKHFDVRKEYDIQAEVQKTVDVIEQAMQNASQKTKLKK